MVQYASPFVLLLCSQVTCPGNGATSWSLPKRTNAHKAIHATILSVLCGCYHLPANRVNRALFNSHTYRHSTYLVISQRIAYSEEQQIPLAV